MYVFAVAVAAVFAFRDVLDSFSIQWEALDSLLHFLPLFENGLGWTVPACLAAMLGYVWDFRREKIQLRAQKMQS
ncbi:branched-chain amino acid permeases [Bacillus sp. OxB-1]|nr:branched-chain amino acid permeases [Bacillus sp. OxB-1]